MATLKTYGSEPTLDIHGFPDCVDPEYLESWAAYISTQTVQDLYNSAPQPLGMQRVIMGFLSSVSRYSNKFLIRTVPGPMSDSIKHARQSIQSMQYSYKFWLDRIKFFDLLRVADVRVTLDSSFNPIGNCINTTATVYLVYVPKPVKGKVPKIGQVLHSRVPYWFNNKEPRALFKTDNLTKKLAKSPLPVVPDTYPTVEHVMAQPRLWHEWNTEQGISCIRTKGDSMVLKLSSPRLLLFLGRHTKNEVERKLISIVRSTFV